MGGVEVPFSSSLFHSADFLNCTDSDQRNALLRDNILCPFAEHEEPETFYENIVGKPYLLFPKVAALFVLHDFVMKASAEPMPLEKYDDPSQHSMYQAALVLYHIDTDDDVRMAIEELEGAAYHISDVDSPHVLTLHSAMQAAMAMDSEDLDEMGLDTEATMEALVDGIGVVNGFIQATAPAKTPAPVTQGASTNESPESTNTQVTSSSIASSASSAVAAEPFGSEVTKSSSGDTKSSDVPDSVV